MAHTHRRLAEAARIGFKVALVPMSAPDPPPGLQVRRVESLADALGAVGLLAGLPSERSNVVRMPGLPEVPDYPDFPD